MIHQTLVQASHAMLGKVGQGNPEATFMGVSTDTRLLKKEELFFCLLGKRDGHEFIAEALAKGASGVVIDQAHENLIAEHPKKNFIVVPDTLRALGDLARAWRRRFEIPILAITGSSGKTTTKDFCALVLTSQYQCLATTGNLNNLIGVPLTLFGLNANHQVAVIEMGMNDFGEIDRLAEITEPTMGVITNIGPAHLEKLSDLTGVAKAKGELFARLNAEGVALVNGDDPYVVQLATLARKIIYGTQDSADVQATEVQQAGLQLKIQGALFKEPFAVSLPMLGTHNVYNVLVALTVAKLLKVPIQQALHALLQYRGHAHRLEVFQLKNGALLIDDCYNANPLSMESALQVLRDVDSSKKTLAILGDMLELGDYSEAGHRRVGKRVAQLKIDYLAAVGEHSQWMAKAAIENGMNPDHVLLTQDMPLEHPTFKNFLAKAEVLLVKGSRGIHLERIVDHLKDAH